MEKIDNLSENNKGNVKLDGKIIEAISETKENLPNYVKIYSEISKEITEIFNLQKKLKEDKSIFSEFSNKIDLLEKKFLENEKIFSKNDKKNLEKLKFFRDIFQIVLKTKLKTKIAETVNTKRNIIMIGQSHYSGGDFEYSKFLEETGKSQKAIKIFLEYFLNEKNYIGLEFFSHNYDEEIKFYLYESYIFEKGIAEILNFNGKKIYDLLDFSDEMRIKFLFDNLNMLTFNKKQYLKSENEELFRKILILKYFTNKEENLFTKEIIESFDNKKFVFIEDNDNILKNKIFYDLMYFIDDLYLDFLEKYDLDGKNIGGILGLKNFSNKNIKNESFSNFIEYLQKTTKDFLTKNREIDDYIYLKLKNFLEISFKNEKKFIYNFIDLIIFLEKRSKKDYKTILFFTFILEKIDEFFTLDVREEIVIKNLENNFPKNQKQVPIIFGSDHLKNWKKWILKHNKENPQNHYSLQIIDFGF